MGSPSPSKGGVVKLAIVGIATYIAGVIVSPYILPIDFISSKLFNTPAQQVEEVNAPTPATPPSAVPETTVLFEKTYKSIVQFDKNDDPFDGVDIVVHRNGEPDPCSRQDNTLASLDDELSPASRLLINAAAKLHDGKKPLDVYDKYDLDSVLTHSLGKLYKCIKY